MGPGVKILGTLASTAELPATGDAEGDGYLIANHFWGWTGTEWVDCGLIQGPKGDKGDQGIQGIQGIKGNKGDRGDRGASIILLDQNPGILDGAIGDVALNAGTQEVFLKSTSTVWTSMGFFGGGNVYSPDADGKKYIRVGGGWEELDLMYPEAMDGEMRVFQDGAWVTLDLGFPEATDGLARVYKDGAWVELDVAADGKIYVRKDGAWVQFNHYDLNAAVTTGACDLAVSNVFKIDNTAATAKTVSFTNAPAGRATTAVIIITGNAGAVNWPGAGITWGDSTPPEIGTTLTMVTLLWDGTRWIGSAGVKA